MHRTSSISRQATGSSGGGRATGVLPKAFCGEARRHSPGLERPFQLPTSEVACLFSQEQPFSLIHVFCDCS